MPTNFNQTVNLREKNSAREKRGEDFYDSYEDKKQDLKRISKPQVKQVNEGFVKRMTIIAAVVLIIFSVYWMFGKSNSNKTGESEVKIDWYTVKLINDEIYYGQISDLSADPVVISNVYYNYNQVNGEKNDIEETGNIRLVKRGKETHGPSGIMNIVRGQVIYMEPMDEESKVLKAILEYER